MSSTASSVAGGEPHCNGRKWGTSNRMDERGVATRAVKIGLMQLSVIRTLQCLVKGEALVSLCPDHAAMT